MKKKILVSLVLCCSTLLIIAQTDTAQLERIRTESGVDPTRVQSRVGYTFLINDIEDDAGQITNRATLTLGVNRWSFAAKYEVISKTSGVPGTGFRSGMGDIKFSSIKCFFCQGEISIGSGSGIFHANRKA